MNIIRVPFGRKGKYINVVIAHPKWVAKGVKLGKNFEAQAWFQPSFGKLKIGTIALSKVNAELIVHESCHAAHHIAGPKATEEQICAITGNLTAAILRKIS